MLQNIQSLFADVQSLGSIEVAVPQSPVPAQRKHCAHHLPSTNGMPLCKPNGSKHFKVARLEVVQRDDNHLFVKDSNGDFHTLCRQCSRMRRLIDCDKAPSIQ